MICDCDCQPEFDPELCLSMSRLWLGDQVTNIRLQPGAAIATAVRSVVFG
jgi:hypothetical protein